MKTTARKPVVFDATLAKEWDRSFKAGEHVTMRKYNPLRWGLLFYAKYGKKPNMPVAAMEVTEGTPQADLIKEWDRAEKAGELDFIRKWDPYRYKKLYKAKFGKEANIPA